MTLQSRFNALILLSLLMLAATVAMTGCSGDDGAPAGPNAGDSFIAVLEEGGDMPPTSASVDTTETGSSEEEREDGTRWRCTRKTVSLEDDPETYATFDPATDVIYPGSLLQGASIVNATPDPVAVARPGGNISIDLLNGSGGVFVEVDEMVQSKIRQGMNDILADNNRIGRARLSFVSEEVQSREQFAASLGVNVTTLSSQINTDLAFSSDRQYNRYMVKLVQTFYTMSWDLPTSIDAVFAPSVRPADLDRYVEPGNPAVYITSVTYGRIFYLMVESTASREEMRASIDASYRAAVAGVDIDADAKYVTELENSRVKAFALGGDPALALGAIFGQDYQSLRDFFTDGADLRTGAPLSYKMRAVKDNRTVKVQVATSYDIVDCVPIAVEGPNPLFAFDGNNVDYVTYRDGQGNYLGDWARSWPDAWGDPAMDAVSPNILFGGQYMPKGLNGGRVGAISFMQSSSNSTNGELNIQGQELRNTDYTIFVVAGNWTQPGTGLTNLLTWGDTNEAGRTLRIGMGDNHVYMSHGEGQTLRANQTTPNNAFYKLYVFRFSQSEGMSIHINSLPANTDIDGSTLTMPIASFSGASIGCADESGGPAFDYRTIRIGDYRVYGKAMSDPERQAVEDELFEKWGSL